METSFVGKPLAKLKESGTVISIIEYEGKGVYKCRYCALFSSTFSVHYTSLKEI